MNHDEWLEEYLTICAAVFDDLRRNGRLEEVLESVDGARTESALGNKDIF